MKMKKFINAPETITDEELVGLGLAYPDIVVVQRGLLREMGQASPAVSPQKIPGYHEKQRYRQPGQHPGEEKIPIRRNAHQWGGVDGDDQQRGGKTRIVQRGKALFHALSPQTVTIKPPMLSPET